MPIGWPIVFDSSFITVVSDMFIVQLTCGFICTIDHAGINHFLKSSNVRWAYKVCYWLCYNRLASNFDMMIKCVLLVFFWGCNSVMNSFTVLLDIVRFVPYIYCYNMYSKSIVRRRILFLCKTNKHFGFNNKYHDKSCQLSLIKSTLCLKWVRDNTR